MKSTTSVSFIIAVILYSLLLLAGYWLVSIASKETPLPEKIVAVPITLNMFQPEAVVAVIQELPSPPPKVEVKIIEKPVIEPIVEPIAEPKVKPKPIPKLEPIIAKPMIKKPVPVKPIAPKPIEKPVEKSMAKVTPTHPTRPTLPVTQAVVKAPPIAPKVNTQASTQVNTQQQANAEQDYLYALRTEILRHAQDTYPRRAKRRQWEGIVTLSFTLSPSGKIIGLAIQKSSGRQILDDAATSIFQSKMHNQFQPFPAEITRTEWKITIPVSYHLR